MTTKSATSAGIPGQGLVNVVQKAGLTVDEVWSWNVLLRPVVALRRKMLDRQ